MRANARRGLLVAARRRHRRGRFSVMTVHPARYHPRGHPMNASISRYLAVLLAGLVVLAAGCSAASSTSSSSGPTSAASTSARPAPSAPGQPASVPVCTTGRLTLRIGGGLASGGADIYYLYFTNTSRAECLLRGYPGVSAVTGPGTSASPIGPGAQQAATWPAHLQLLKPGRAAQATLRFARTGNFAAPQCHHVNVLFLKIVPPGDTTAAYAGGIDEQICAQATLPTMTITTVIPDS
jgi:hypothetical protein